MGKKWTDLFVVCSLSSVIFLVIKKELLAIANWRITFRFTESDAEVVNYEDYH
jgi:hypothetical protein